MDNEELHMKARMLGLTLQYYDVNQFGQSEPRYDVYRDGDPRLDGFICFVLAHNMNDFLNNYSPEQFK